MRNGRLKGVAAGVVVVLLAAGLLSISQAAKKKPAATKAKPAAAKASFQPFVSEVHRGGDAPIRVFVDVTGVKQIRLIATVGPDDYHYDSAAWCEPVLIAADGTKTSLRKLKPASVKVGWGKMQIDKGVGGRALQIGGKAFTEGVFAHAPSQIIYTLDGKYVRFEAWAGVTDRAKPNGSSVFKVLDRADKTVDAKTARKKLAAKTPRVAKKVTPPVSAAAKLAKLDLRPLRMAIEDLIETFGEKYPKGKQWRKQLAAMESTVEAIRKGEAVDPVAAAKLVEEFESLRREALLGNPLLDFDKLLLVNRSAKSPKMGLPQNWQGNCVLPRSGFDDEISVLSPVRPGGKISTLYKPKDRVFVGDVDLNWDGERMLFSSIGTENRWHIFEMNVDGTGLRQVTPGGQSDYDSYDACYLPDGRIIFDCTACLHSVPCVFGSAAVANLYLMNPDGSGIRQLCFDQDHDWNASVLNNGRVLYQRWEYTDTPHSNTRLLFQMNPDGTNQMAYYGSNSYWPNSVFYPRAIPGHPTKVVGIVTGHHGSARAGEMVVFDPAVARQEADGAIHRIPQYGKEIKPIVADRLVDASWPKFLHPYPLNEKYFLVSAKLTSKSLWGIYLVDVFDNMLLLAEQPGQALLEPVPLRAGPRPPVIVDKVDLKRKDALVYLTDVHQGGGLAGVPRGTVKKLRVFTYHFGYPGMGGLLGVIGADGPWDIKRVLGTVPVEEDGSALFRVPANTPISIQPLDEDGKALQVMRSWFTAMPGEVLSCVGCHEKQNDSSPNRRTAAAGKTASEIAPWHGAVRGFHYPREVQPVLDKHCVGCHAPGAKSYNAKAMPDLRGVAPDEDFVLSCPGNGTKRVKGKRFSKSYLALHPLVRRPGIESDYHMLSPLDYHADTTELAQMLRKGHHGVTLDAEGWDRIVTWIDLNAPFYGTWTEIMGEKAVSGKPEVRQRLQKLYAGISVDPEAKPAAPQAVPFVQPAPRPKVDRNVTAKGWPLTADQAAKRQAEQPLAVSRTVDLGGGAKMHLTLIPAGEYVMGDADGYRDEAPLTRVKIDQPFWMGVCEVTNAQYALFDPDHDSHVESKLHYQFGVHGYPLGGSNQPVVRVSWKQAAAFCQWVSERTGQSFTLPTEAQWEYACRAGTDAPLFYGGVNADFSKHANVADAKLSQLASNPYTLLSAMKGKPTKFDDYVPKIARFNDGSLVSVDVGTYAPNAWGLRDMHGNVAEWTLSTYRPYPYNAGDGRDAPTDAGRKVVRGGSWRDRPARCRSAFRLSYPSWQRVYNVGFRVVCPATPGVVAKAGRQEK